MNDYQALVAKLKTFDDDQWNELFHDINDFDVIELIACASRFFLSKNRDGK